MRKQKLLPKEPSFIDKLQAERKALEALHRNQTQWITDEARRENAARLKEVKQKITRFLLDLNADGITPR